MAMMKDTKGKKPAVKIVKAGEPRQGGGVRTPMPKKVTNTPKPRGGTPMPKKGTTKPTIKPMKPKTKSKMTPEDKAYDNLLKKYKGDVTKIPGFKNGKGTM